VTKRVAAFWLFAMKPVSRACSAFMLLFRTLFFSGCVFGYDPYQHAAPWPYSRLIRIFTLQTLNNVCTRTSICMYSV
jgi:hypothetical protein